MRWSHEVVKFLINMAADLWKARCEIVNEKDKRLNEDYTRKSALDLALKLKETPWSLPSASRHLLERDRSFFREQPMREISAWLRRVQYGVQEIEATEARGATDIRTWVNIDYAELTSTNKSRSNKSTPVYKKKYKLVKATQMTLKFSENTTAVSMTSMNATTSDECGISKVICLFLDDTEIEKCYPMILLLCKKITSLVD